MIVPTTGPKKRPDPPTITASSIISDAEKWNGAGLDEFHERREVHAADAGARGADREREQRVGGDVDAEALGADRVVAQRGERAAPRRAQEIPQHAPSTTRDASVKQKNAMWPSVDIRAPKGAGCWRSRTCRR